MIESCRFLTLKLKTVTVDGRTTNLNDTSPIKYGLMDLPIITRGNDQ